MESISVVLNKGFESLKSKLIEGYERTGRRASGNWEDELEVEIKVTDKGFKGTLFGANYTYWLENGRKQNKNQSHSALSKFATGMGSEGGLIYEWCSNKGIAEEYAIPIAYKVGKEGYEGKPFIEDSIKESDLYDIINKVGINKVSEISSDVVNSLQNGNN